MTDNSRAKTILELSVLSSFDANDRIIVHDTSANTTKQATKSVIQKGLFSAGPYANDSVANTAGVAVGEPYYNANGAVFVRLL